MDAPAPRSTRLARRLLALLVALGAGLSALACQFPGSVRLDLVPVPRSVEFGTGEWFEVDLETAFHSDPAFAAVSERQLSALRSDTGLPLLWDGQGSIRIERDESQPAEGYELHVTSDRVRVVASSEAGVFYAFQTLRQLSPSAVELPAAVGARTLSVVTLWRLPPVVIRDAPRFSYRGLHLDVGRYYFDVNFVKRYIDLMAHFKLNRFHWHLTEDQGWRVEIDAYPRLTEVGAWRAESPVGNQLDPYVGDGRRHGGFYTKEQIREVVAYAADRYVTVIPEIEMPGHATAAIASYPELGCTEETLEVSTTWGVHDTVFCPSEETFDFLETVLDEVMELFPSELVHIGGDEVPKRQWQESAEAQAVMEREGLADEDELQSWFIRRIERHLNAKGRRLIGWDEILEGGLAPNATVMSWRGTEGGIAAARQGHDVIMTPVQHAYFDFYQGDVAKEPLAMNWAGFPLALETVYAFEPVPDVLTEQEAGHVLGAQGNLWTEYIATPEHAEYMTYPRALALAEVVWSPVQQRDWEDFVARLPGVLRHLDALEVNYRVPEEVFQ